MRNDAQLDCDAHRKWHLNARWGLGDDRLHFSRWSVFISFLQPLVKKENKPVITLEGTNADRHIWMILCKRKSGCREYGGRFYNNMEITAAAACANVNRYLLQLYTYITGYNHLNCTLSAQM